MDAALIAGLVAAVSYGAGDFLTGILSRQLHPTTVIALCQAVALPLLILVTVTLTPTAPEWDAVLWGALAGFAGAVGSYCFVRGFRSGQLGAVAPAGSVAAGGLPVVIDLLGGATVRPLVLAGMVIAVGAAVLVGLQPSHRVGACLDHLGPRRSGSGWSLGAGSAHAAMYLLLDNAPGETLWPIVSLFAVIVLVAVAAAATVRAPITARPRQLPVVVAVGVFSAAGTAAFFIATHAGTVSVASVLTELSPAITVLLAAVVLREHLPRLRVLGVAFAIVGTGLIGLG